MGAEVFYNRAKGTSASKAFNQEHQQACYENGHGGYTGSIAEKSGFTMSHKPKDIDANKWVEMVEEFDYDDKNQDYFRQLKKDYEVYDDKWGDALCVPTSDGFIFCGWASD